MKSFNLGIAALLTAIAAFSADAAAVPADLSDEPLVLSNADVVAVFDTKGAVARRVFFKGTEWSVPGSMSCGRATSQNDQRRHAT